MIWDLILIGMVFGVSCFILSILIAIVATVVQWVKGKR